MSEKYQIPNQSELIANHRADKALGRTAIEGWQSDAEVGSSDYEILDLDNHDKSFVMRRSYLRSTFRLTEKIQKYKPDYVLYLDKSARPVSWLERELHDDFAEAAAEDGDEPEPKTNTLFLNIDREHWRDQTGGKEFGSGQVTVKDVEQETIESLRAIFLNNVPEDVAGTEDLKRKLSESSEEDISDQPSLLDGKKVLIVDEVKFTGDTLKIAQKFLETAFPDAEFATHHWMTSPKAVDPNAKPTGLPDVPVWYRQDSEKGRGVANRDVYKSRKSASARQRVGEVFLSTSFNEPDSAAIKLRSEFKRLAQEYRHGVYGTVEY